MINVSFIGMDLYQVGEVSAKLHTKVAKAFGVNEEEVVFSAFDSFVYYKGHEQTSINLYVKIDAEEKFASKQKAVAELLLEELTQVAIHITVYFNYIKEANVYQKVNDEYPRFLTFENAKPVNDEGEYEDDDNVEVYTGDIFSKFKKDLEEDEERPLSFDELTKRH